jgi:uncharacterized membrane protein YkoI
MKRANRRIAAVGAATAVLAVATGAGIAQAVSGSEESVPGAIAQKARVAAVAATGGGTALEVERQDGDAAGAYEVEVRRPDGSAVEVHLDARFRAVGTVADDDMGSEQDGSGGSDG